MAIEAYGDGDRGLSLRDVFSLVRSSVLVHELLATFTQPQRSAPWKVLPSTYVLTERDNAVPTSHQAVMAPRCGAVVRLDCDHSPFVSHTAPLASLLASLASA